MSNMENEREEGSQRLLGLLKQATYRMKVPEGNYEFFSKASKQVFGYESQIFIKNPLFIKEIIHPDFQDYFKNKWRDLMNGVVPPNYEYKILDPDGNERWIYQSNIGIYDNNGNIIAIEGICRNITERKQMEEHLSRSQERFRSLVETTSDWIWEVDENATYIYSSPKIQDLLGYKAKEIIGKTPFDLMPQEEAVRVGKIFQSIAESQEPFARLENMNLHKNGSLLVLETSGVPIFDEKGNFKGYRGIDRDITERKKAEQALKDLNKELGQRIEKRVKDLKESEEKYRSLLDGLARVEIGIDIVNNNYQFLLKI